MQIPRLREKRELQGLTQKELADVSGVSVRSVAGYESGAGVRPNTARKLAEALDVKVADLVGVGARPKAGSPLSAERALAIADPDDFRRIVKDTPTAELEQTALELAKLTKVPTREDLVGNKDNKAAHQRTMANYCISVINVALDSRGVRSPVEHVAMRLDDALTPPEEPQEEEKAG